MSPIFTGRLPVINLFPSAFPDRVTAFESNPSTLDDVWRDVTDGIYQLEDKLMIKLNIDRLLNFDNAQNE